MGEIASYVVGALGLGTIVAFFMDLGKYKNKVSTVEETAVNAHKRISDYKAEMNGEMKKIEDKMNLELTAIKTSTAHMEGVLSTMSQNVEKITEKILGTNE